MRIPGGIALLLLLGSIAYAGQSIKTPVKTVEIKFLSKNTLIAVQVESNGGHSDLPTDEFDTSIAENFKIPAGIERDAAKEGFKLSDLKTYKGNVVQSAPFSTHKFRWGQVYTWQTPTRGSATFSYICRAQDNFCFKIGPYPSYWDFNWKTLVFSALTK